MELSPSGSPTAHEVMDAFLAELSTLRVRAKAVAKLRHGALVKGLAGPDENGGQLQAKVLQLMDEIEVNFRIIGRKLDL